jgi:hypothetical protein
MTATDTCNLQSLPAFTFKLPSTIPTAGLEFYYGISNPAATTPGVSYETFGPASVAGQTLTFAASPSPLSFTKGESYSFVFYSLSIPQSLYFIDNYGNINIVPTTANGSVSSTFTIPGNINPALYRSSDLWPSLAVDTLGNIYAPSTNSTVNVYAHGSKTAQRTLSVPLTPYSVAVDPARGIYVLGYDERQQGISSAVYFYAPGETQPEHTITGPNSGLAPPPNLYGFNLSDASQIAVDSKYEVFVSNAIDEELTGQADYGILYFASNANGDPPADQIIQNYSTPDGGSSDPTGLAVTPDGATFYLVNGYSQIDVYTRVSEQLGSTLAFSKVLGSTNGTAIYFAVAVDSTGTVYALDVAPNNFPDVPTAFPTSKIDVFSPNAASGDPPTRSFTTTFPASHLAVGP